MNTTVKLLFAGSLLMLLAGCFFAFMKWWFCAILLGVGAFGGLTGAVNFKSRNGKE